MRSRRCRCPIGLLRCSARSRTNSSSREPTRRGGTTHTAIPTSNGAGSTAPDDQADVTDHAKFDIVHARARAWINVLRRRGGSARETAEVDWATDDPFLASADHAEVLTSGVPDNPELVIGFNDYVPDDHGVDLVANVVIALGDPAVSLARVPDCGCDFCDYGSDVLLQQLDSLIFSIVDGSVEAQSGGQYSGYRTSFDAAGELSGDAAHKPAKHRARPWFDDWSPRPMQDWA